MPLGCRWRRLDGSGRQAGVVEEDVQGGFLSEETSSGVLDLVEVAEV